MSSECCYNETISQWLWVVNATTMKQFLSGYEGWMLLQWNNFSVAMRGECYYDETISQWLWVVSATTMKQFLSGYE